MLFARNCYGCLAEQSTREGGGPRTIEERGAFWPGVVGRADRDHGHQQRGGTRKPISTVYPIALRLKASTIRANQRRPRDSSLASTFRCLSRPSRTCPESLVPVPQFFRKEVPESVVGVPLHVCGLRDDEASCPFG
jgi:hypothetical protein